MLQGKCTLYDCSYLYRRSHQRHFSFEQHKSTNGDSGEDVCLSVLSSPEASALGVAPLKINYTTRIATPPSPLRTRGHHFCDYCLQFFRHFIPSFLIFVHLLFATYQIVLACYNCGLQSTNLGWIRASFFLNCPFVLGVFVYIGILWKKRTPPSFSNIAYIALVYTCWPVSYSLYFGTIFEKSEVNEIIKTLQNTTALALLPCPASRYRHVLGMKIAMWYYPMFIAPLMLLFFFISLKRLVYRSNCH